MTRGKYGWSASGWVYFIPLVGNYWYLVDYWKREEVAKIMAEKRNRYL